MTLTYLEQQRQYIEFLNELDALFRKHNIEHVYATDSTIHLSRSAYDTWTFGSWILRNDGTRRYTRPGISEYCVNTETAPTKPDTEVSAIVEPLVDEPPTQPEPVETTITAADTIISETVETWDTAKQEQITQEINPKIDEYINDLADKLYAEAKARNFPKNTLGEYWTHPAVVRAVKQNGFNESAYLIISANTTYWHRLADRMRLVELLDKQQSKQENTTKSIISDKLAEAVAKTEPVAHMDTFSTDTVLGTWTIHYSDYKDSVYLDSGKGRAAIISKVHNWMLIFSRMHPELKNAPTRANIDNTFTENFNMKQSFRYKWYEFVVDVSYSTPLESENTNNA